MKDPRKLKGFTIIELVAVIAIILIIASMIVPRITSYTQSANSTKYLVDAKVIAQAVELYNTEKVSDKIEASTPLISMKSKLIPSAGKKYLNTWPSELKVKVGNVYEIAKTVSTEAFEYEDLLSFIENPEPTN